MKNLQSPHFAAIMALWAFLAGSLLAGPAFPGLMHITQTDGSTLSVYLKGDEHVSLYYTEDHYALFPNPKGIFEYAEVKSNGYLGASGVRAHNIAERSEEEKVFVAGLQPGIFYSEEQVEQTRKAQPINSFKMSDALSPNGLTIGTRKLLVILVNFQDKAFFNTQQDFDNMFNQRGYSYNNATGSVKDYFRTVSYGQFELQSTVVGPYTIPGNMRFYGEQYTANYGGQEVLIHDRNAKQMIIDACNAANADVDFRDFDQDHDGFVDNVFIVFAGRNQAESGPTDAIWPHRSVLEPPLSLDGVRIKDYGCASELNGMGVRCGIGTICHEYGHVLGLLDYYDTDYAGSGGTSNTIGDYDIMNSGNYLNGGNTPPMYGPLSRIQLGWATPVLLDASTHADINAIKTIDSNLIYRINTDVDGEFILLEARGKRGQDSYIPYSGLTVYRVDGNSPGWRTNEPNINPNKQAYEIIRATGNPQDDVGAPHRIFDRDCPQTELNSFTHSQYKSYSGDSIPVNLSNIHHNPFNYEYNVTFQVNQGASALPSLTQSVASVSQTGASIDVVVTAATANTAAITERGVVYSTKHYPTTADTKVLQGSGDGAFQATLSGLSAGTEYFVRAFATTSTGTAYSNEIGFYTITPAITNNTIIPGDYAKCSTGELPLLLASEPQGGNGRYTYRWLASSDGNTWEEAPRSNAWQNYVPESMNTPTYYCRVVSSGNLSDTTDHVLVNIVEATLPGTIEAPQTSILANTPTGDMTLSGQAGRVLYWQRKIGAAAWNNIENTEGRTSYNDTPTEVGSYKYRVKVQNGACPELVSAPVSVEVNPNAICMVEGQRVIFSLYPNPVEEVLTIETESGSLEGFDIRLVDVNGKKVHEHRNLDRVQNINLSHLPEGYYLAVLYYKGHPITQKQIVKIK